MGHIGNDTCIGHLDKWRKLPVAGSHGTRNFTYSRFYPVSSRAEAINVLTQSFYSIRINNLGLHRI